MIGSVAGDRGRKRNYVYGSAKGALHLFVQGLRARLSKTKDSRDDGDPRHGGHAHDVGREGTLFTVPPERAADLIFEAWRKKRDVVYVPVVLAPDHGHRARDPGAHFQARQFLITRRCYSTPGGGPFAP